MSPGREGGRRSEPWVLGPPLLRGLGVAKSPAKETGGGGPVGAEGSSGRGLLGPRRQGVGDVGGTGG